MKSNILISPIIVGNFVQLSTIDYPGKLSSVIFCQGCPLRCPYCYNQHLQPRKTTEIILWLSIIEFLKTRMGLLDAVVFSGGEPTQQTNLLDAIKDVKSMNYKIGLHTAGVYPNRLKKIIPFVDWIGLDIKTTKEKYDTLTGMHGSGDLVWQSLDMVINSGVSYETRTTLCSITDNEKQEIEQQLSQFGNINHVWQKCHEN